MKMLKKQESLKSKKPLRSKTTLKPKTDLKNRKRPKPARLKLRDLADKQFSRYIRLRDCSLGVDGWYGQCITCSKNGLVAWVDETGALRFTKGWDAGHFVGRSKEVTRFEEENVNLQCAFRCNKLRSGERDKYRIALAGKYGQDTAAKLEAMADEQPQYTLSIDELDQIIKDCNEQIKFYQNGIIWPKNPVNQPPPSPN